MVCSAMSRRVPMRAWCGAPIPASARGLVSIAPHGVRVSRPHCGHGTLCADPAPYAPIRHPPDRTPDGDAFAVGDGEFLPPPDLGSAAVCACLTASKRFCVRLPLPGPAVRYSGAERFQLIHDRRLSIMAHSGVGAGRRRARQGRQHLAGRPPR